MARSMQQDEWDDTFWNSNHKYRKTKARKTRHKGLKSSTIREGIQDYFLENGKLKGIIPDSYQESGNYDNLNDTDHNP